MSVDDPQTDLSEFDAPERPAWSPVDESEPDTGSRVQCQTCEHTVSRQFALVFGNNENEIHACPNCSTYREFGASFGGKQ